MAVNLFQSPKRAAAFVGMTMFSVAMLVGSEDNQGALVTAANGIQQEGAEPMDMAAARPRDESIQETQTYDEDRSHSAEDAFASDEELIDDASGFDPTPELDDAFDTESALSEADGST